jgi:4-carboxymuconolactone decarboxylase
MDRMPPLSDSELSDAQAAAKAAIINGPRGTFEGPFIPLLRSPDLMGRLEKVGEYLRFGSRLPARIREMAILMIARAYNEQTEWGIHYPIALKAGLSEAIIAAIAESRRPATCQEDEQATWDFLNELHSSKKVSDTSYNNAKQHFGEDGIIDLTSLSGYYTLLAQVMNVAQTPPPSGAARLGL